MSRRDGSQPCVVLFGDTYYLFLSNAGGGYYASDDLCTWRRVESDLPPSLQAVAVAEMGGSLYLTADSTRAFYRSSSPGSGRWQMVTDSFPYRLSDPSLFCDGDRLFLYAGSGDSVPLTGMELDPGTLMPLCAPVPLIESRKEKHGWEIPGDYHAWKDQKVWIEGTWMSRHEGRYYLQYTSSGIQYTGSNQGVYVGDSPLGPFEPAPHNPFAYKPEGFVRGRERAAYSATATATVGMQARWPFRHRPTCSSGAWPSIPCFSTPTDGCMPVPPWATGR